LCRWHAKLNPAPIWTVSAGHGSNRTTGSAKGPRVGSVGSRCVPRRANNDIAEIKRPMSCAATRSGLRDDGMSFLGYEIDFVAEEKAH
jgi:hypothetical protein